MQVIGQTVEAGDEAGLVSCLNLETLLILKITILAKFIPWLAEFLLRCGGNRAFDGDLRVLALNALNWTVQYKQSKVQSHNLAPAILEGLMPIASEEEPEAIDDDARSRSALSLRSVSSMDLRHRFHRPSLPCALNAHSESFLFCDPTHRRAAMLALNVSVEGCSEYMAPLMSEVWPVIEAVFGDSNARVCRATCVAVSCLCEWLEDECVAEHTVLVPAITNLINDPEAQPSACTALDALPRYRSIPVKSVITGAIGSAVHASKERFLLYFEPIMSRPQHFLVITGEGEEVELRGITMDATSTFAEAICKDVFRPFFPEMMKQAFQGR
ncbi:hypothetical protein PTI98_010540 [Pleurotus ostreatus]|nr:hypothetical protein PTI98_010540 [Pleurotus ostreatus]